MMKIIQKAKTSPKSYGKKREVHSACDYKECLASCKKCPPMTC